MSKNISPIRIIPVLDLMQGAVVRGRGGRREEYAPIQSQLVPSSEPVAVAKALLTVSGAKELYLADLDAIQGGSPNWEQYQQLRSLGVSLWVDAGIQKLSEVEPLIEAGIERIILGLETLASPRAFREIIQAFDPRRFIFSLDLKQGQILANPAWKEQANTAEEIADDVLQSGITRLILLDLSRVGMESGTGTESLGNHLRKRYPDLELIVGGGIRNQTEIEEYEKRGMWGVLVASALHDGRINLRSEH